MDWKSFLIDMCLLALAFVTLLSGEDKEQKRLYVNATIRYFFAIGVLWVLARRVMLEYPAEIDILFPTTTP